MLESNKERYDVKVTGYSYLIAVLCMLTYAVSFVSRAVWNSSIAIDTTLTSLNITTIQAGTIASAFYVGYVVSNFLSGFIVDKLGPKLSLIFAGAGTGIFTLLLPFSSSYPVILVLRVLAGVASGPLFGAVTKMNYGWFDDRRRGVIVGFIMSGPAIGMAFSSAALTPVVANSGYKQAFLVAGVIAVVVGVLMLLLGKERGLALASGKLLSPEEKKADTAQAVKIFFRKNVLLVSVMNLLIVGAGQGLTTWILKFFVEEKGMTAAAAGAVFGGATAVGLVSGTLVGLLSDLLKTRKYIVVIGGVAAAVLLYCYSLTTNVAVLTCIAVLMQLSQACMTNGANFLQTEQVKSPQAGKIMGWYNGVTQLGSVIFPTLLAAILTAVNGRYFWVLMSVAAAYLISVVMVLFCEDTYGKTFNQ